MVRLCWPINFQRFAAGEFTLPLTERGSRAEARPHLVLWVLHYTNNFFYRVASPPIICCLFQPCFLIRSVLFLLLSHKLFPRFRVHTNRHAHTHTHTCSRPRIHTQTRMHTCTSISFAHSPADTRSFVVVFRIIVNVFVQYCVRVRVYYRP